MAEHLLCWVPPPGAARHPPRRGGGKKVRTVECPTSYRKIGSHFPGSTLLCRASYRKTGAHFSGSTLASRDAHVARQRWLFRAAVDDEVMSLRLPADGLVDGAIERIIIAAGPQRRPQFSSVVLAEAHVKGSRARQAYPVAALAEIVRHRGDEADPATGFLDADVTRRTAGAVGNILERPSTHEAGPNDRQGQELIGPIAVDVAERHGLDQGQIEAASVAEPDKVLDFILVHVLQGDRV